ncbi:hypothetical protein HFP72_11785 [Nocardiopsis sp. ARC36]
MVYGTLARSAARMLERRHVTRAGVTRIGVVGAVGAAVWFSRADTVGGLAGSAFLAAVLFCDAVRARMRADRGDALTLWLAAMLSQLRECVVYLGLAAGAVLAGLGARGAGRRARSSHWPCGTRSWRPTRPRSRPPGAERETRPAVLPGARWRPPGWIRALLSHPSPARQRPRADEPAARRRGPGAPFARGLFARTPFARDPRPGPGGGPRRRGRRGGPARRGPAPAA